jgi:hypothetical protein
MPCHSSVSVYRRGTGARGAEDLAQARAGAVPDAAEAPHPTVQLQVPAQQREFFLVAALRAV